MYTKKLLSLSLRLRPGSTRPRAPPNGATLDGNAKWPTSSVFFFCLAVELQFMGARSADGSGQLMNDSNWRERTQTHRHRHKVGGIPDSDP